MKRMKKKAVKKTIIDILKTIGFLIGGIIIIIFASYLLTLIPYWVLNALGLWETCKDVNAGVIYSVEILILAGIGLGVYLIHKLYRENLTELENKER